MTENKRIIYLDNNATTKVDERVVETMLPYFSQYYGNPSSIYDFGGKVQSEIKKSRESIKELFGAKDAKEIYFTGSGSESSNMAIKGILESDRSKTHIITTKVEHPCVLNTYKYLEKNGYSVTYLGVDSQGDLDLNELSEAINEKTALVSVMMANNETGVIFPINRIGEIIKERNKDTKFFVDAVQGAGKININVADSHVDLMSVSGHKFHAPKGVAAL